VKVCCFILFVCFTEEHVKSFLFPVVKNCVLMQVVKGPGPQSPVAVSNSHSDVDEEFQDALR